MAKSNAGSSNAVQTTFTKQKRELAKANELINQIRAQEKRLQRFTPDGKLQTEERESYLLATPQEIANKVLTIVAEVVSQHGARQVANSVNKGRFAFMGIEAELTVPQLRALQDAAVTLRNLVDKLPMENKRCIPNEKIDGMPAFATPLVQNKEKRTRIVPYEEVVSQTREVTVDYGLPAAKITALREMAGDLDAAIQVAIDEANAKPHANDPVLNDVAAKVADAFRKVIDG